MLPPARRQIIEQHFIIQHPQVFRAGELDNHIIDIELLGEHRAHVVHHYLFLRARTDIVDGEPALVNANKKTRAAHITQLIEHDMAVVHRQ